MYMNHTSELKWLTGKILRLQMQASLFFGGWTEPSGTLHWSLKGTDQSKVHF
jgi:hypothetical protein